MSAGRTAVLTVDDIYARAYRLNRWQVWRADRISDRAWARDPRFDEAFERAVDVVEAADSDPTTEFEWELTDGLSGQCACASYAAAAVVAQPWISDADYARLCAPWRLYLRKSGTR